SRIKGQRNRWPLIRASALTLSPQFSVPNAQPTGPAAQSQPQRSLAGRSDCRQLLLTRDETRQTRQEALWRKDGSNGSFTTKGSGSSATTADRSSSSIGPRWR